jgi:2-polyprenyl-6-methoxyphenol hydroxylase-like FAD-dependent oxidoreductase
MSDKSTGPIGNALVVGGGIAGLTAAVALGQTGVAVDVVDVSDGAEGTGIGLQNRGPDALDAIGILEDVIATGAARERVPVRFFDAAGKLTFDPGWEARGDGKPAYILIYRPLLSAILRSRAEAVGARLRIGLSVDELHQDLGGADVRFTDGTAGRYDLVVGADGIRSRIRSLVFGQHIQPSPTGSIGLRWVPTGLPRGDAGFYYGPSTEMVVIPMHDDMTYVSVQHMADHSLSPDEARQVMRDKLGQYTAPFLRQILGALDDESNVLARKYEVVMVDAPWHRDRVVLIGDAAHATTAQLGSGGVMALEDAVVLAEELRSATTVPDGLASFGKRRHDRCRLVVEASQELSRLQLAGASAGELGAVRGAALQTLSQPY